MQRRTAVKYLFVIAAGSALLPSCLDKNEKTSVPLKHLDLDMDHENLLAELGETIIPSGAAPGAKDTYAHLFVLKMVDDCYDESKQKNFMNGLKQLNDFARKKFNTPFLKASSSQRNEIVNALENKKAPEDILSFYSITKPLIIQGYISSKLILGTIFKYELVPGRYNGFFPIKTIIHQV